MVSHSLSGLPAYEGSFPRASRSSQGRGEAFRKSKNIPKGDNYFDLLATVAGLLHDAKMEELNEENQAENCKLVRNKIGCNSKTESAFEEKVFVTGDRKDESSKDMVDILLCNLNKADGMAESMLVNTGKVMESLSMDQKQIFSKEMSVHRRIGAFETTTIQKYSMLEEISTTTTGETGKMETDTLAIHKETCTNNHGEKSVPGMKNLTTMQEGAIKILGNGFSGIETFKVKDEGYSHKYRRWSKAEVQNGIIIYDESPPMVSSSSSGEVPCLHRKLDNTNNIQAAKNEMPCLKLKDTDDNSSELIIPEMTLKRSLKASYIRTSEVRSMANCTSKSRDQVAGLKRKQASIDAAGPSSKFPSKRSAESNVKLTIKSFTVPELLVDLPESATIANLKRAVMDAATNLLGGGLCVKVLIQGKKIPDENASLIQAGILHHEKLNSLGFMLEPNPTPTSPTTAEDPILLLSRVSNQARYPKLPVDRDFKNTVNCHTGEFNVIAEPNVADETASGVQKNLINKFKHDMQPSSTTCDPLVQRTGALILHPGLGGEGVQGLALVSMQQKPKSMEIGKRRMRRPFTVAEVEALVEAVEKLGTGRWRDVKLCAFEQAIHRTYVDLKDKWKTLVHTAHIAPHQRRGEPVPQELLDRVIQAHSYWTALQAK